jgi:hypothetical protein
MVHRKTQVVFPHVAGKGAPLPYWPERVTHLVTIFNHAIHIPVDTAPAELGLFHIARGHRHSIQIGV